MKLIYRGTSYEYNPTNVEGLSSVTTGKYRGVEFQFSKVEKVPVMQTHYNLTYRGVKYNVKPNTDYVFPASGKVGSVIS
ncbi:DUF4278 domain-containing protein [Okeania sp.]|uniref:DUF4278 domain-containing protein n=1 Tax=Okeania sp. TaxID=3100323 RepID=UPI002B4B48C2|nr:DUF4278 domain-containing protein [Okeania sp.]MEB3342390.1 DUF4278 domain-containing protein [Okeania sp.]